MSATDKTSLGDRIKAYEIASRITLPRRMPVMLRVDGKAFHSFTAKENCDRPFDQRLTSAMNWTAEGLCQEIQGAQFAYVQSDEITVLIHNYKRLNSEPWFDNQVQKMVSVAASIATASFNRAWAGSRVAHFDARVFVLPEAEVCNAVLWRQQDATRNSIQMLARSLYSHKECENKNGSELQEMCHAKGHNWNDLPTSQKRGRCIVPAFVDGVRRGWVVDNEIPVFSADRRYIEYYLATEAEEAA